MSEAIKMKLSICGAHEDISVDMAINLPAMLEDPERSFPAVARKLGEQLADLSYLLSPGNDD